MANVLIVDDERSIRIGLEHILAGDGHRCKIAPDANMALQILGDFPCDVVVSDIILPDRDGIELLQEIRGIASAAQVIMMTGQPSVDTAAASLRAGAFDYLTKPIGKNAVLRSVGNAVRIKAIDDERRRLEKANRVQLEQLEIQNEELRKAAEFREEVEQITRHDLKAPLNLILGIPQLLLDTSNNLTPKQQRWLNTLETAGRRMLDMINLSLDLFRIEQGMYRVDPAPIDVLPILAEIRKHQAPLLHARKVALDVSLDGRAPIKEEDRLEMSGDAALAYCVLSNLVKNAIEASPPNATVAVACTRGDALSLRIHNRGPVPPEIRETFFDKCVTHGKDHGAGLGTYAAKLCVEAQGGSIRLDTSRPGETAVEVALPAAP